MTIDVGSTQTRAHLFARVEDRFRFVATASAPTHLRGSHPHLALGGIRALAHLSAISSRPLLDPQGILIAPELATGAGVDACLLTLSAAPPIRVILGGLSSEWSLASLRRAAASAYTQVAGVLSVVPLDGRRQTEEEWLQALMVAEPHLVVIAGGMDGGAAQPVQALLETATLAARLRPEGERPWILFAGNAALREAAVALAGRELPLRVLPNVRPQPDVEHIGPVVEAMDQRYVERALASLPGLSLLQSWARGEIVPTARALGHVARYLSLEAPDRGTLVVDVGGNHTVVTAAHGGLLAQIVQSESGIGQGILSLYQRRGYERIARWLPQEVRPETMEAFVWTKAMHPLSIPQTIEEMWMELAFAREALAEAWEQLRTLWPELGRSPWAFEPILLTGGAFASHARPGALALMALDALQPVGLTTLLWDPVGVTPALGALAAMDALLAVEGIHSRPWIPLATVLAPTLDGPVALDELLFTVEVHHRGPDGSESVYEIEVRGGRLEVVPIPGVGETELRRFRMRRPVDLGWGPRRAPRRIRIVGGWLGLIVDGRGRPLQLAEDPEARREQIQRWLWDIGALGGGL
ncbi:glutamate mutase L [Thermoflexus sp.]|uniref:glutamate mutase L n=1 Tax=Thermoflexus sp. TaxID=1969742 RepID=UPI0035E425C2